jgi:hypothetical protein
MSRSADITQSWGGEERTFRLGLGQCRKLQENTGCGPLGIAARCNVSLAVLSAIRGKDWLHLSQLNLSQAAEKIQVRETLKQGLLGAQVALPEVDRLLVEYVDERPLDENLIVTIAVCMAAIYGVEDEEAVGEPQAAPAASPLSQMESSGSEKTAFTPSAQHVASPRVTSTQ